MLRAWPAAILAGACLTTMACAAPTTTAHVSRVLTHTTPIGLVVEGPRQMCDSLLPGRRVQAWESVSVKDLRAYQYGGPVAHHPLGSTFPGVPAGHPAAWCWVQDGAQTGSLWGVVPGVGVGRAITITGPGPGIHGVMKRPPQVP
jgi:hypothetical protein